MTDSSSMPTQAPGRQVSEQVGRSARAKRERLMEAGIPAYPALPAHHDTIKKVREQYLPPASVKRPRTTVAWRVVPLATAGKPSASRPSWTAKATRSRPSVGAESLAAYAKENHVDPWAITSRPRARDLSAASCRSRDPAMPPEAQAAHEAAFSALPAPTYRRPSPPRRCASRPRPGPLSLSPRTAKKIT